MPVPLPTGLRMRTHDDNGVYFCENSCATSYSGCLDEDSALNEQAIAEFIRYSKPPLYQKLNGVCFASSYLAPGDGQDEGDDTVVHSGLERTTNGVPSQPLDQQTDVETKVTGDLPIPKQARETLGRPNVIDEEESPQFPDVETVILGDRYLFTSYRHNEPEVVYCCASPTCPYPWNVIPVGSLFGCVQDQAWSEGNHAFTEGQRTAYYCCGCLQEVVENEAENEEAHKMLPWTLDGACGKALILKKAEDIHPPLKKSCFQFVTFPEESPPELGQDSNSKAAIRVRRQKQYEVYRILEDIHAQEFRRVIRASVMSMKVPDTEGLKITAPLELEPVRERYRKQGFEQPDPTLRRGTTERAGLRRTTARYARALIDEAEVPMVCYCRELPDDGGMIRCSSKLCMFGWIHLRCAGPERLTGKTEEYLCKYCKGGFIEDPESWQWSTTNKTGRGPGDKKGSCRSNKAAADAILADSSDSENDSKHEDGYDADEEPEQPHLASSGFVAINSTPAMKCDDSADVVTG